MSEKIIVVDLSDARIKGYANVGQGLTTDGITQSESGIVYENACTDENMFPMFAVDFKGYLSAEGVRMEDVKTIEMVATVYDDAGNELDLSSEYQKCAFVSRGALDGYSASDILPGGNYKVMGSNVVTTIDLTKFTGYASDGKSPVESDVKDGVGLNIQILNGDYQKLHFLVISRLTFVVNVATIDLVADLSDFRINGYVNRGYGTTDDGVTQTEEGMKFEIVYSDFLSYPMFAIDFSEYLSDRGIRIEDVESFDIVATIYDEAGREIDMSSEYQKCAFVSRDALDGYSDSDILPNGNYKQLGSSHVTTFDLTSYSGYASDGYSLTDSTLEDGVGFNIQLVNGEERSRIKDLVVSQLVFHIKKEEMRS